MTVLIGNKNGSPICDRIYTQIRSQIISGALASDELRPSIRNLAKDLRISFITTKRAYEELEKDGFIYTVPGKRCGVRSADRTLFAAGRKGIQGFSRGMKIKTGIAVALSHRAKLLLPNEAASGLDPVQGIRMYAGGSFAAGLLAILTVLVIGGYAFSWYLSIVFFKKREL